MLRFSGVTDAGTRYGELNQDAWGARDLGDGAYVLAVFDGHSPLGEIASRVGVDAALARVSEVVEANRASRPDDLFNENDMKALFTTVHETVLAEYERVPETYQYSVKGRVIDFALSSRDAEPQRVYLYGPDKRVCQVEFGATAVVAVVCSGKVVVGNVGDSRCVIGGVTEDSAVLATSLTTDHNLQNQDELQRIIKDWRGKTEWTQQGYIYPIDQHNANLKLNVTRAIGHALFGRLGVLHEPAITSTPLLPGHQCLVLASDGVWDVMSDREVIDLVLDYREPGKAAREVCQHALTLWDAAANKDNTTALVALLE